MVECVTVDLRPNWSEVRTASGCLQGSQLFKTCFERCCDGVAERDQILPAPPKEIVSCDKPIKLISCLLYGKINQLMTESINIFTVKEGWVRTPVGMYTPPFDKLVGLATPDGKDLLVPGSNRDYVYGGGYSDGFVREEVTERELAIGSQLASRLAQFFEEYLIGRNWVDVALTAERYDCSWFAFWMKELIDDDASTDESLDMAQDILINGRIDDSPLNLGQIGVLGGSSEYHGPWVDHSFIGMDGSLALQAVGMHGPIAVAPQNATIWSYMETSQVVNHVPKDMYGVHVPDVTGA